MASQAPTTLICWHGSSLLSPDKRCSRSWGFASADFAYAARDSEQGTELAWGTEVGRKNGARERETAGVRRWRNK